MRPVHLLIAAAIVAATAASAEEKANELSIAGQVTMTAPDGFTWKKTGEQQVNGKTVAMYLATSDDPGRRIFIAIEPGAADTDAHKLSRVKGFHKGIVDAMPQMGFAATNTAFPDLKPPIPDRVLIPIPFKDANGDKHVLDALLVFGKKGVYLIQSIAATAEESEALIKPETLKE